jgi:hypothetical protein
MKMALVADDIVVGNVDSLPMTFHWNMTRYRRTNIQSYGKSPIDMDRVQSEISDARSLESAEHTARYLISSVKHAAYLAANYKELFLPLAQGTTMTVSVKHAGLESHWSPERLDGVLGVSRAAFDRELADYLTPVDPSTVDFSDRYKMWLLAEPRLQPAYTGNPNIGALSRALWAAKRAEFTRNLSIFGKGDISLKGGQYYFYMHTGYQEHIDLLAIASAMKAVNAYASYKPSLYDLKAMRANILEEQSNFFSSQAAVRQTVASGKFTSFWERMKSSAIIPTVSQAAAEWATIPLKAPGTETSRTWGIEIETVRANDTSRPSGWESRHDGSLPDSDEADCSCSCDDCCDNDHCNDRDYCYESGEFTPSGRYSREFVSPILKYFNSDGLRHLCSDLGTDVDEDAAPGIHVHVGASDLTVADVTRLLVAYSAVERFMEPLLHRKERGYCKETTTDTLRWWLRKTKEYAHRSADDIPLANQFAHDREATPLGRYVDVNLHALSAHGTIEFRSMGAWYDYQHLIRWAWFCREMVNVSKLGIDQREWTSCRSITDVIQLLRKYGSELPSNDLFAKLDADSTQLFDEL